MRTLFVAFALVLWLALPARADGPSEILTLAEQGDAQAQFVLGNLYRDGQGVEKNLEETVRWWTKAAELGNVDAQFALGNIFSGGFGIPRDYVQSFMWFDIAAAQTEAIWLAPIARSNRDALVDRMTAEEVSKAKQMSADWISRHGN